MASRLTIGEFATLTHLSVRTLRRYHADGLLEPAAVDPFTNYRYMRKLRVYAGGEHPHEAQQPAVYDFASKNPKNKRTA